MLYEQKPSFPPPPFWAMTPWNSAMTDPSISTLWLMPGTKAHMGRKNGFISSPLRQLNKWESIGGCYQAGKPLLLVDQGYEFSLLLEEKKMDMIYTRKSVVYYSSCAAGLQQQNCFLARVLLSPSSIFFFSASTTGQQRLINPPKLALAEMTRAFRKTTTTKWGQQ